MSTMGERIREARLTRKMTQKAVADHFGISRISVTQWESNTTRPDPGRLLELAQLLNVTAEHLLGKRPAANVTLRSVPVSASIPAPFDRPNATIGAPVEGSLGRIPVYGQAVGGVDGEFVLNGNLLYETMRPPSLSGVSKAYAVSISGDSMSPRYEDGEVAFVDPTMRPRRGSYVVAQVQLEEHGPILAYVKRFVRHSSDALVLEQFNPPKELTFAHENVVSVHCVVIAGIA